MTENSKKCLEWIKDNYGISFDFVDVNGKNIVDLVLEWHNKMLIKQYKIDNNEQNTATNSIHLLLIITIILLSVLCVPLFLYF